MLYVTVSVSSSSSGNVYIDASSIRIHINPIPRYIPIPVSIYFPCNFSRTYTLLYIIAARIKAAYIATFSI